MDFQVSAPLDQGAVAAALAFGKTLPALGPNQKLTHQYLHWRVSSYLGGCNEYNALVSQRLDGSGWVTTIQADPRLNATEPVSPGYAAHTWMRNSHAFGLSVDAMASATPQDFGAYPITLHEIETLCACAASVCLRYNIDASDENLVMTHGEAACYDRYFVTDNPSDGITRWDLARLTQSQTPLTKGEAFGTGRLLRQRIHLYKEHMNGIPLPV